MSHSEERVKELKEEFEGLKLKRSMEKKAEAGPI